MNAVRISVVSLVLALCVVSHGHAAHQSVQTPFGEKVIHTRLMPVLLHKAVPPYAGKHVYQGRIR